MSGMQEFTRALLDEQQRIGAQRHKAAQRATRLRAELKGCREEVARLQAAEATVQKEVADAFERMHYALTGETQTPDDAYAHDLFARWQERWQALIDCALDLRQKVEDAG